MTGPKDKYKRNTPENRCLHGFVSGGTLLWVIVVLGAVAVAVLVVFNLMKKTNLSSSGRSLGTFTARRDDLTITVGESGSLKARNETDITSHVEGRATILNIVPEGYFVTQEDVDSGKVLLELDSSTLKEQVAQFEIDLASTEAAYADANEGYLIQVKQNESDITAAELAVRWCLMDLQKYLGETIAKTVIERPSSDPNLSFDVELLLKDPNSLGGSASRQLKVLRNDILLAEGQFEKATDVLEGTQKLHDANYASDLDLKSAQLDVDRFRIQQESADEALRLYQLYDFPKEAEKFFSDYQEAGRELDRTNARARSEKAQKLALLKSAEARYELQIDRLEKQTRQIEACVIRAPAPGLVVYASSQDFFMGRGGGSSRTIGEGETVFERQRIISLPNTAEMIAEIAVHESSVDMVRVGQQAKIVVDPFPDQAFSGQVLKVAQLPDPRRGFFNPDLKVYTTQVSIEGNHEFLKPGMSVNVEILVEQLKDIIIVPVQVVANRGGKKVCYVATPKGPAERQVQTGAFNDTFVQIIDGLEVGVIAS